MHKKIVNKLLHTKGIYNSAFSANEYGYAQAKAIIFLIVVAGIGLIQLIVTKKKEVEM